MLTEPRTVDDLVSFAGEDGVLFEGPHGGLAGRRVALRIEVPWAGRLADALLPVRALADEAPDGVVFLRVPFDREPILALVPEEVAQGKSRVAPEAVEVRDLEVTPVPSEADWVGSVEQAVDVLGDGLIDKVVLARQLEVVAAEAFLIAAIAGRLTRRYPAAYRYVMDGFVGATPELLMAKVERELRSVPMAGTAARGRNEAEDAVQRAALLASTKDQHEHRILAEQMGRDLGPFCEQLRVPPHPELAALANVYHLASPIYGVLHDAHTHVLDLLAAVHPTPAIAGAPTDAALGLIRTLEPQPRGPYGGAIGWFDREGNGTFALALRGAMINGASARLFAGAGIVAESDPRAELAETNAKFRVMLEALGG